MKVIYPNGLDGEVSRGEAEIIAKLASFAAHKVQGSCALEIGTFMGSTTNNIAANFWSEVITVDLPKGAKPKLKTTQHDPKYFHREKKFLPEYVHRITQVFCDSADLQIKQRLAFAFIDGCHTYEYVINDFEKVEPFMSDGGIVLFHDFHSQPFPGVTEGIEVLAKTYSNHIFSHLLFSSIVCCTIVK